MGCGRPIGVQDAEGDEGPAGQLSAQLMVSRRSIHRILPRVLTRRKGGRGESGLKEVGGNGGIFF